MASARRDLVVAVAAICLSVGYIIAATTIHVPSQQASGMTARDYPLWLGVVMLIFSVALAVSRLNQLRSPEPSEPGAAADDGGDGSDPTAPGGGITTVRPVVATAAAAGYLMLLPRLGFLLATPLLVAVLVVLADTDRRYRGGRLVIPVAVGCVIAVAAHIAFDGLLGVFLPGGLLDPDWGL